MDLGNNNNCLDRLSTSLDGVSDKLNELSDGLQQIYEGLTFVGRSIDTSDISDSLDKISASIDNYSIINTEEIGRIADSINFLSTNIGELVQHYKEQDDAKTLKKQMKLANSLLEGVNKQAMRSECSVGIFDAEKEKEDIVNRVEKMIRMRFASVAEEFILQPPKS